MEPKQAIPTSFSWDTYAMSVAGKETELSLF